MSHFQDYDVVIIGAGIGGLLTMAGLCQQGKRVVLLERLSFTGGRFTSISFKGVEITTGALHLVPHASRGILSRLLLSLGIPHYIHDSDVFASFHTGGKHFICYQPWEVLSLFSTLEKLQLAKMALDAKFRKRMPQDFSLAQWLKSQTKSVNIRNIFERITNFTLSISPDQLTYNEAREVLKKVIDMGGPGILEGGCRNVIEQLEQHICQHRGSLWTNVEAVKIWSKICLSKGLKYGIGKVEKNLSCGQKKRLVISVLRQPFYSLTSAARTDTKTKRSQRKQRG